MVISSSDILFFLFLYVSSMWWHEVMHSLEVWRQCGGIACIKVNFSEFTAYTSLPSNCYLSDYGLFDLAGGVYTSVLFGLAVFCVSGWVQWSCLCICWLQLCYGSYEYWTKGYVTRFRYVIYGVVILVFLVIWLVK